MSYVFQSTLIDTMQQYAALAAEEYLSAAGANGDAIQHSASKLWRVASADGKTIGRRILINQPDDENAKCKALGVSVQHKDFSHFTQQPTTPSTFNAISFQQGRTGLFEPRPWTHGIRPLLPHEHDRQRDHSRLSFDNVTKPSPNFPSRLVQFGSPSEPHTVALVFQGGGAYVLTIEFPAERLCSRASSGVSAHDFLS